MMTPAFPVPPVLLTPPGLVMTPTPPVPGVPPLPVAPSIPGALTRRGFVQPQTATVATKQRPRKRLDKTQVLSVTTDLRIRRFRSEGNFGHVRLPSEGNRTFDHLRGRLKSTKSTTRSFPSPLGSPLVTSGLQGIESSHDSGNFLQAACESHATGRSAGRFASIAAYLGQP